MAKKYGGLGFQDIQLFNAALIAKRIWRLLTVLDSLASRVLKSKYYPNLSLFEAQIPQSSSWLWRSWHEVLQVCAKWMHIEIRNDTTTKIWDQHWLSNLTGKAVELLPGIDRNCVWVKDLMTEDGWNWDEKKLRRTFPPHICALVLTIKTLNPNLADIWRWKIHSKGLFTVQSTYAQLLTEKFLKLRENFSTMMDSEKGKLQKGEDEILQIKVVPKKKRN
ncbi:Unknown protein [Striga hermonthica]|uniref:Uncharacterized protein n=1 Tax=Striga hermonthica TaxID=68872 RepID=A0A9N7NMH7_STRHE|nr:Unknown protein [Striga hermonthica]